MIATSKIRPDGLQTVFPPFGSLAITQRLIDHGSDNTYLFDIDGIRPTDKEIKERLINDKPDVNSLVELYQLRLQEYRQVMGFDRYKTIDRANGLYAKAWGKDKIYHSERPVNLT
jgi:hypothetical protein